MRTKYKFSEGNIAQKDMEYIEGRLEKLDKLLSNYDGDAEILCEVEINKDKKDFWNIEIILQTPHKLYRAEETNQVLTEAFDKTEEMLKKQILRDKKRIKDLRERGGRSLKKRIALDVKARF